MQVIALGKVRKIKTSSMTLLDDSEEFEKPHIELCANKAATIEGCHGIIEYCETTVRINCGNMVVRLCGGGLEISSPNTDTIVVKGMISGLEFYS